MLASFRILKKHIKQYKLLDSRILRNHETKDNFYFYSTHNSTQLDKEKSQNFHRYLYSKILACGPITIADYMQEVLTHPKVGYYMSKDVFGEKGDFTTSPEITQLFGEIIAVWMIYEKRKISKDPFQIVELGPGRGTLMKDILRVFKRLGIFNEISVHLVEISPTLSSIQAKNLCTTTKEHITINKFENNSIGYYREGVTENGVKIYWYNSIKDIPKSFSIFVAHEFFDALPIHKFQKTDKGWSEVLVDIIEGSNEQKFRYILSNGPTPATIYIPSNEKRSHVEISPQCLAIIDCMAKHLWECGGFALICDYGHNGNKTDTFRAFSQHKLHDPLENPGTADLTADVDFAAIKRIAEQDNRLITFGPINQAIFLQNLGIDVRLQMLLKAASEEERKRLESGYRMIMDEDKMGKRFKVLSMFPSILKNYFQEVPVSGFHKQV